MKTRCLKLTSFYKLRGIDRQIIKETTALLFSWKLFSNERKGCKFVFLPMLNYQYNFTFVVNLSLNAVKTLEINSCVYVYFQVVQHTYGSFYYNCYRTEKLVPDISNGQIGKREYSNLLIQKLSRNFGVYIRTNPTWIMKQWVEP